MRPLPSKAFPEIKMNIVANIAFPLIEEILIFQGLAQILLPQILPTSLPTVHSPASFKKSELNLCRYIFFFILYSLLLGLSISILLLFETIYI